MKNQIIILLILYFFIVNFKLGAHPIELLPSYYPEDHYKTINKTVPELKEDELAVISNKKIKKHLYYTWLADYGNKSYLFNKFINEKLIRQKLQELNISHDKQKNDLYYLPSLIVAKEWEISDNRIEKSFKLHYGINGKKYDLEQVFIQFDFKYLTPLDDKYYDEIDKRKKQALSAMEKESTKIKNNKSDFDSIYAKYLKSSHSPIIAEKLPENSGFLFGEEFLESIAELQSRQVSPVVESEVGYHIVKIIKQKEEIPEAKHLFYPLSTMKVIDRETLTKAKNKAFTKIKTASDHLQQGMKFENLARTESDDYSKAFFLDKNSPYNNQWDSIFGNTLRSMKKGDISPILESEKGLHIVKIKGIKQTKFTEEIKEILKQRIAYENVKKNYKEFTDWLQSQYSIIKY